MANFSAMTQSRRRPKRQRTPTTIYTDDNPTTFTTKKKKGQVDSNDDDNVSRRSSTGNSSTASWNDLEESLSMPPPAPKRGPGRPPSRRKSAENHKVLGKTRRSSTGSMTTKQHHGVIPDSLISSSSSGSTTTATASSAEGQQQQQQQQPVKRKRGRPPKNRPKEIPPPSVDSTAVESEPKSKMENDIKTTETTSDDTPIKPLTNGSREAERVADETEDPDTNRRRSLPESSPEPMVHEGARSRRSLDALLSTKKDVKCLIINNKSGKNGSTRIPNIKRRSKSGHSKLLRGRANSSVSWTPPHQDIEGTFVNHSVTVAPILPPILIRDNDENNHKNTDAANNNDHRPLDEDGHNDASESNAISRELKSKYPVVFDKGVPKASSCIAPPFSSTSQISSGASSASSSKHKIHQSQHGSQLPTWSPLYNPPVFFEDDYDEDTGNLDVENTMPVKRHITAMTVRKPEHDYLVLGDSVGFVTIYSLSKDNITLPIAQLESLACQQRGKAEQERLRADLLKRKKPTRGKGGANNNNNNNNKQKNNSRPGTPHQPQNPFSASGPQNVRSIVIDTSDTMIQALGMIQNRVVLATSEELECMDVPSGTSLWVCPLSANRFVTSLDMHLNTFDVLVSCSKTTDSMEAMAAPVSPLMLLQHSEDNVEICDANSPMLVRSPSCTAIWDIGASNRLLFIALSANRQEHELVLVSGGSIDSWKVACKTKIPTKASSSAAAATKLSQSPGGVYTLVACSRGIRLYQTESLQLIHIYGDQFTLHGQSVMWKDCWLAGSFFSEANKTVSKAAKGLPSQWLQCDDWVGEKIGEQTANSNNNNSKKNDDDDKTPNLAPYIIGVPHTKGPKELCENLHVWKVEEPSVVPMMSIPLPHKAEGALGLVGSRTQSRNKNSAFTEDRIVLVTDDGQGHLLSPKMESNFAGIVYPPGYQVVTNNIEYIEDEEATDQVLVEDTHENDSDGEAGDEDMIPGEDDESMDEELREAMRQSLLEHNGNTTMEYDEDVDILGVDDDEEKEREYLPCRPEPYLRQMVNAVVEGDEAPETEKDEKGAKLDNDEKSNANGMEEIDSSKNEAVEPKLTDEIFISNVLQMMPNMPKIKPMEEDCLSFTTTKVVVAVNPVVRGRGRKSRAANLETMLKASINPYLQSMMLSRQGVPVNGNGSKLRAFDKNKAKAFSMAEKRKPEAGAERVNGEVYSTDSSVAGLNVKTAASPRHATNDDEAAVVMGLLGLSPCATPNIQSTSFVSSDSKEVQNTASATNGQPKGSAYLNSSSLSLLGVKNDDNQVVSALSSERGSAAEGSEIMCETTTEKSKLVIIDKSCSACRGRLVIHSCGKRSLPIDYEAVAKAERERKEKEEEEKKRIRAEKRRLADQKRREAKKKKERELEEQRLREENERLEAEQRRRIQEEFAAKTISNRREQIRASYADHVSTNTSYQAQPTTELRSVNYSASQAVEVSTTPNSNNTQIFQAETTTQQYPTNGQVGGTHQSNPSPTAEHAGFSVPSRSPLAQAAIPSVSATMDSVDALVALASLAGITETLPESRSEARRTLSNDTAYAASGNGVYWTATEPTVNQYNIPQYGASHGFSVQSNVNETVSSDIGGEANRGIPSYATIRDTSGSPNEVASGMSHSLSATSSFHNGRAQQTSESNNYSWSSRPDNQG